MKDYASMDDEQLVSLLFTYEDRLPRSVVEEFIWRGDLMVEHLSRIVSNSQSWTKDVPEWWAVVHASFILGAIGTDKTILPLLKALRYSAVYGCDWVANEIPSIFGRIGPKAVQGLKKIARDETSGWFERSLAIESLASIALRHAGREREIFGLIGSIFENEEEDRQTRQSTGNVLLDLQRTEYRDHLLRFAREEVSLKEKDDLYPLAFGPEDVEESLSGEPEISHFTREWLSFYTQEEIKTRQERWRREDRERRARRRDQEFTYPSSGDEALLYATPGADRSDPCPCGSGKKFGRCCGIEH